MEFVKDIVKIILASILGGIVALASSQFFYISNHEKDAQIQIKSEVIKEQIALANGVKNLTSYVVIENIDWRTNSDTANYYKKQLGLNKIDNVKITNEVITIHVPDFIFYGFERKRFVEQLNRIDNNREKLDYSIYEPFDKFIRFIYEHPLPMETDPKYLITSDWSRSDIQNQLLILTNNLRDSTSKFLNKYK